MTKHELIEKIIEYINSKIFEESLYWDDVGDGLMGLIDKYESQSEITRETNQLKFEQNLIYNKVMEYFPQDKTFVDILQAIDIIRGEACK